MSYYLNIKTYLALLNYCSEVVSECIVGSSIVGIDQALALVGLGLIIHILVNH